jgi:transposase
MSEGRTPRPLPRGGRPVSFDTEDHKHRNLVGRAFNRLKNWRDVATRYDTPALVYRGGIVLPRSCCGSDD